jgi:hypothetical protein
MPAAKRSAQPEASSVSCMTQLPVKPEAAWSISRAGSCLGRSRCRQSRAGLWRRQQGFVLPLQCPRQLDYSGAKGELVPVGQDVDVVGIKRTKIEAVRMLWPYWMTIKLW